MWTYDQATGNFLNPAGYQLGRGYSGKGVGLNNPAMQNIPNVGPIPKGTYDIGAAYYDSESGEVTMRLTPRDGTEMYGRDDFKIHGDLIGHVGEFLASRGCIIASLFIRQQIADSGDTVLEVV